MIEFAATVLGIELFPWQKWLLIHMLELLPDNTLRFRTVVVLVARQNGKSTLSKVLALWWLYVYGVPLVIGTAQDLDVAQEIWQDCVDIALEVDDDENLVRPDLAGMVRKVNQTNGSKSLTLTSGSRYKVKASTRKGGRSLTADVVLLDELREHQTWDAYGALTKTTMARKLAQILCLSNAGDAASVVLAHLRRIGHEQVGDPDGIVRAHREAEPAADVPEFDDDFDDDDLEDEEEIPDTAIGLFEWSAPPGCGVMNRDGWAQANPSLGHGGLTLRAIAEAAKTDPEWVFRTEVLCQWPEGTLDGLFPAGAWEASADPPDEDTGHPGSKIDWSRPVGLCVDVSWDRRWTHIGIAGYRVDGRVHVEVIASRAGTDWVLPWIRPAKHLPQRHPGIRSAPIACQTTGPAASLIATLRRAGTEEDPVDRDPVTVIEWSGTEVARGSGDFYDAVAAAVSDDLAAHANRLFHRDSPRLNLAAQTCVPRNLGSDGWAPDRRRSPSDASPLISVIGARWLLLNAIPKTTGPPPKPEPLDPPLAHDVVEDVMSIGF